jgi:recombination protein RecA
MGEVINMKPGKIDINEMKKKLNKKAGLEVAHSLGNGNDPSSVVDWIPTGSRWLDSIISIKGKAGIPIGKITEIAGLSGTGKSYMAAQIAGRAQDKDIFVVYFDAESAVDPDFLTQASVNIEENFLYFQAISVEKVLESIEMLMDTYPEQRFLFIWDSIAATSSEKEIESDFNPQSTMAVKPRIFAKAFPKLTIPLANNQCTLLLINQLKTNITTNIAELMTTPFIAPGGKAIEYFSSLRVWLTGRKSKASYIYDDVGRVIGSEVKATIQKSRFGSLKANCTFKIMWGEGVGIQDEESWFTAIKLSGTDRLKQAGAWYTITTLKGKDVKFQATKWIEMLKKDDFRATVFDIMDEAIVRGIKLDEEKS